MTTPSLLTRITVTGRFMKSDGTAAAGKAQFTPSLTSVAATSDPKVILPLVPVGVELDGNGAFSVDLFATDDPDSNPSNWTYQVREVIDGAPQRAYWISVPQASPGGALDLSTVVPVIPAGTPTQYALVAVDNHFTASQTLESTFDGGGNTSDSTSRLNLQSHQRAVAPNHFGEVARLDLERDDAKAMIAWRENYSGSGPRSVAWIGAHGKSNDGLSWHNHISIEVPDASGALQTALEVPFAPWNVVNGFGISAAEVYVRAVAKLIAGGVPLIVEGSPATDRNMHFGSTDGTNVGGKDAFRRWTIRADSTAEGGANAGSDLRIVRRADAGSEIETALFIRRSNGQVGIGTSSPAANLDIGSGSGTVTQRVNRGAAASTFASLVLASSGTDRWSLQMRNDSTEDLHVRNSAQGNTGLLVENRATAPNISLLTSAKSYGGGVGVIFVPNASTVPGSTPTGGGVLYVESGALKYKGSSGTITTLGAA